MAAAAVGCGCWPAVELAKRVVGFFALRIVRDDLPIVAAAAVVDGEGQLVDAPPPLPSDWLAQFARGQSPVPFDELVAAAAAAGVVAAQFQLPIVVVPLVFALVSLSAPLSAHLAFVFCCPSKFD